MRAAHTNTLDDSLVALIQVRVSTQSDQRIPVAAMMGSNLYAQRNESDPKKKKNRIPTEDPLFASAVRM